MSAAFSLALKENTVTENSFRILYPASLRGASFTGTEYGISYDGYGSRDGTGTNDFWKYDDGHGTGTDYF